MDNLATQVPQTYHLTEQLWLASDFSSTQLLISNALYIFFCG